ncbi:MAG: dihydroneopterin aldolase [Phycisphaerae bacterium]|nr:dihydroneopterin aldolase [Phycisphaerae bacterium]
MDKPFDQIHIRDLQFRCIIGIDDIERKDKQDIVVNLTLEADLRKACESDQIVDTVDYKILKQQIVAMGEKSSFSLIETLAQRIADICLAHPQVHRVRVLVEKPAALRFARTVGVEIERDRVV